MEGATQKSLDEEVKSTDNLPMDSTAQKPKAADEDGGSAKSDVQSSANSTLARKDKPHAAEDKSKDKCPGSNSAATASTALNGQTASAQERDVVDGAVAEPAVAITPQSTREEAENVTPNDKANGT